MHRPTLNRRAFLGSSLAAGMLSPLLAVELNPTIVAAVQMGSHVGDIDANLEEAENWIRYALRRGARWIVLPEFFTSGMSYRTDKMLDAALPIDGTATQMLKRLSKEGNAFIGGTLLASSNGDVFNTFVLTTPDGQVLTHDKDFPSGFVEHSFYAGGEDHAFVEQLQQAGVETLDQTIPARPKNIQSGVLPVGNSLSAGAAICWEQLRYRTARRLRGNVDLVLASSAWGDLDPDVGVAEVERSQLVDWGNQSRKMLIAAPQRLARLVGAPVIHANAVGSGWSNDGRKGKPPMLGRALGHSQIVDGQGRVLATRPYADGEGLVVASVTIARVEPTQEIPANESWTPDCSASLVDGWKREGASGRDYYLKTARPYRNRE